MDKSAKTRKVASIFLALTVILGACGIPKQGVDAASIRLNKTKATIEVGDTVQLSVKGTKSDIKWSSSDKSVATVKKGLVTGRQVGKATIKAKVEKKIYKCVVTVKKAQTNTTKRDTTKKDETFVWEPGTKKISSVRTGYMGQYGYIGSWYIAPVITGASYEVILNGSNITKYTRLEDSHYSDTESWIGAIECFPQPQNEGDNTLILHVDGFEQYVYHFEFKRCKHIKGCVQMASDHYAAVQDGLLRIVLIPEVIGKDDFIEVYVDGEKQSYYGLGENKKLKIGSISKNLRDDYIDGVVMYVPKTVEAKSTHHIKIVCPGFETFDEDVEVIER